MQRLQTMWRRSWRGACITALVGAAFFVWGLVTLSSYGASWDEPLHYAWGKLFLLSLSLGSRSYLYMMPGNGVYYSPLYYAMSYIVSQPLHALGLPLYQAAHIPTLAVASVGVASTYLMGVLISGCRRLGFLAVMFLVGFPQFLAHAHYNPKDIPLMSALALAGALFLASRRCERVPMLLLSAACVGLSIALKVTAILVLPAFVVSFALACVHRLRQSSLLVEARRRVVIVPALVLAFVVGLIVAWPSAWGDLHLIPSSIYFFLTKSFWPGTELYFGKTYTGTALPWSYIPLTFALSTPLLTLIAFTAGITLLLYRLRILRDSAHAALLLLWILVPLLVTTLPGLVRYDGIRQFLFLLPAGALVAALGADMLLRILSRMRLASVAVPVAVLVFLGSLSYEVAIAHPLQGSYRNEIARVLYPKDMDRIFALEYWGASYAQGFAWLGSHGLTNAHVCIPIAGALAWWYTLPVGMTIDCSPQTDYVMFFTRYDQAKQAKYAHLVPVYTIERMGATLLKIYQVH